MVSACVWPGKESPLGFTGRLVVLADKDERWPEKKAIAEQDKGFLSPLRYADLGQHQLEPFVLRVHNGVHLWWRLIALYRFLFSSCACFLVQQESVGFQEQGKKVWSVFGC